MKRTKKPTEADPALYASPPPSWTAQEGTTWSPEPTDVHRISCQGVEVKLRQQSGTWQRTAGRKLNDPVFVTRDHVVDALHRVSADPDADLAMLDAGEPVVGQSNEYRLIGASA